jgi:hypothetical protein
MSEKKPKPKKDVWTVRVTCDLTPPHNFLRETRHTSEETAIKAAEKAHKEFKGTPGLKVEMRQPEDPDTPRRTSWERIVAAKPVV